MRIPAPTDTLQMSSLCIWLIDTLALELDGPLPGRDARPIAAALLSG